MKTSLKTSLIYTLSFLITVFFFCVGCSAEIALSDTSDSNVDFKYEYSSSPVKAFHKHTGEETELEGEVQHALLSLLNGLNWNPGQFKHVGNVIITFADGNSLEYCGTAGTINDVTNYRTALLLEEQRLYLNSLVSYYHVKLHFDSVDELRELLSVANSTKAHYDKYVKKASNVGTVFLQDYAQLLYDRLSTHPIPVLKDERDAKLGIDYFFNTDNSNAILRLSFEPEKEKYVFDYCFKGTMQVPEPSPHAKGQKIGNYIYKTNIVTRDEDKTKCEEGTFLCENVWVTLRTYTNDDNDLNFEIFRFKTVRPAMNLVVILITVSTALIVVGAVTFVVLRKKRKKKDN